MKNLSNILIGILFGLVIFLFTKVYSTPKASTPSVVEVKKDSAGNLVASARFVYVNIDSINNKYAPIKSQSDAANRKSEGILNSLAAKEQQINQEMMSLQQRAEKGELPPAQAQQQYEALQQRGAALLQERDRRSKELGEELGKFQESLYKKINDAIAILQKEKGFDFVLMHTKNGGALLYANESLDITNEVLAKMNEAK